MPSFLLPVHVPVFCIVGTLLAEYFVLIALIALTIPPTAEKERSARRENDPKQSLLILHFFFPLKESHDVGNRGSIGEAAIPGGHYTAGGQH